MRYAILWGMLVVMAFACTAVRGQFTTPSIDGTVNSGEYGNHSEGQNQQSNGGTTYLTWDASNLYIAITNANIGEAFVFYLDKDPQVPVNGGSNSNGTMVGKIYDNTNFAALQFRADLVCYVKSGYREYSLADGSNNWGSANTAFGNYAENGSSNTREFSIPWSALGGMPSSFNFFCYVTSGTGYVYNQLPAVNSGGSIGTSARYERYYTVSSTTNGVAIKPFSRESYVFNSTTSNNSFGAISVFDFTMNSSGLQIARSSSGGDWTISGNLVIASGTVYFGSGGSAYGNTTVANIHVSGGFLNMDQTNKALVVSGNVNINSGTLQLSGTVGGDLNIAGNFTKTGGSFICNARQLNFNGTSNQLYSSNSNESINFLKNANGTGVVYLNSSLTIAANGQANFNGSGSRTEIATGATLTFNDGTTLATTNGVTTVYGTIASTGITGLSTATSTSFASLIFASSGVFNHNATRSGTTIGPVPQATWQVGSTCSITGLTNPNSGSWPTTGMGANFSLFVWNTPLLSTSPILSTNLTVNSTLTIQSTGGSEIRISSGSSQTITTANYLQAGGTLNLSDAAFYGALNITGSFAQTGGIIRSSGSSTTSAIAFNGTSNQSLTFSGTVIGNVNFAFNNAAGYTLSGTVAVPANCSVSRSAGTFSGAGTFSYGPNCTLIYNGSAALGTTSYEFALSSGPANLSINNNAGITLHAARSIAGSLLLTNGLLNTSAANLLTLVNNSSTAVVGGGISSYVNGPLAWNVTSGQNYSFPVGGANYMPVGVSNVSGSSLVLQAQAFSGNCGGSIDATLSSISTSEYWHVVVNGGTISSVSLSFSRQPAVNPFTGVGRSSTANGTYGNIGGVASGSSVTSVATGSTLGYYVLGVTVPFYYWSNAATMNWSNASNWQTTTTATYTSPSTASIAPNASNSLGITIRNGHTVSTNGTSITADQLTIAAGGILNYDGGTITIENGTSDDVTIESGGKFTHTNNLAAPSLASGVIWRVKSGGSIEVNTNTPGSQADYYASNENSQYANSMVWENDAVFVWNSTSSLSSSGLTYFPTAGSSTVPIFRLSNNISLPVGANAATTINGLFEANGNISWQNTGDKTFRNGIIGTGTITQNSGSGPFIINGATARLGGTGTVVMNSNGLFISAGTTTLISNKPINATSGAGTVNIAGGAIFDAGIYALTGTANYLQSANGTLVSASASGVNGSIQLTGNKTFTAGANYTFNGSTDQTTGVLMGTTIGSLTVNNPNTVTLSNNNHTTTSLNLNAGFFKCGNDQNLNIASGGTINGNGGEQPDDPSSGSITFLGSGQTTGTSTGSPRLYSVILKGPVQFRGGTSPQSATILNQLRLDVANAVNADAPYYGPNSTLVYNSGGVYARSVEWGQVTPALQGYPYNILVQNSTTVNLSTYTPSSLEIGGNLTIGTSTSGGNIVDMSTTTIPLRVLGNLVIGDQNSSLNSLRLSSSSGGDLELYGNFTRYKDDNYYENEAYIGSRGRSTIFKGSANTFINVIDANNSVNEVQKFHKMVMNKAGSGDLTLLVPNLFIESELELISGVVNTIVGTPPGASAAPPGNDFGLLTLETNAIVTGSASASCYVNGQIAKQFGTTTSTAFLFPVGKTGAPVAHRPFWFSKTNSAAGTMKGEYFYNAPPHIGSGISDYFASSLLGIVNTEYWQFDKTAGDISGKIIVDYTNPGDGNWRGPNGANGVNPCSNCNVAVVKRSVTSGDGVWDFTSNSGVFSSTSNPPEFRFYANSGKISSAIVNAFSPFTVGFSYNIILGTPQTSRLVEFTGVLHNGNGLLNWKVENAAGLREFVVQHSSDGIQFTPIGKIHAGGFQYNFTHPQLAPGRHFYRIQVRDQNGNSYLSKVVELLLDKAATSISSLQTTVASSHVTALIWSVSNQKVEATIYDMAGRLISRHSSQLHQGNNSLKVPVMLLAYGLYNIHIQTADGVHKTLRWIKE